MTAKKLFFLLLSVTVFSQISGDDVGRKNKNVEQFPGESCYRDCKKAVPRTCYFKFHLENYHVMGPACGNCGNGSLEDCFKVQCITADGFERGVMSINRQIPGPPVHVCKNDKIVVDVTNMMGGSASTLHWHGFHQRETPHMDGVPFVTQCPINAGTTFRYNFPASDAGTQFYHSHTGHHKVNGHYGGFIVRTPKSEDPNSGHYDLDLKEHMIVASDWMEVLGEEFAPGQRSKPLEPSNFLINGKGVKIDSVTRKPIVKIPLSVFHVKQGKRYRFRWINTLSHICPVTLDIEDHPLQIIASDSFNLKPVWVDKLFSEGGERYDFVINTNQTNRKAKNGFYWIRIRGIALCAFKKMQQFAVLSYGDSSISNTDLAYPTRDYPQYTDEFGQGRSLNDPAAQCGVPNTKNYCITDLSSYSSRPDITNVVPDRTIVIGFGFGSYNNRLDELFAENKYESFINPRGNVVSVAHVNNISFSFPSFSLLSQPGEINSDTFCDANNLPARCIGRRICSCTQNIKIKLGSVVEMIIVDQAPAASVFNHPFHMHGYGVIVTGMGQQYNNGTLIPMSVDMASRMSRSRTLRYTSNAMPPIKDTISIPSKGYIVFRFKADNPGFWLFHCHFEWHLSVGMGFLIQVGETSDMVKAPDNFPECRNYVPNVNVP